MSFTQNIRIKEIKARKNYFCEFSGKLIKKGETYICQVNTYEGKIFTFRICKEAEYLAHELDLYGKGTNNDGFIDEDYEELLSDYISENDLFKEYESHEGLIHDFVYAHYMKNKKVGDEKWKIQS